MRINLKQEFCVSSLFVLKTAASNLLWQNVARFRSSLFIRDVRTLKAPLLLLAFFSSSLMMPQSKLAKIFSLVYCLLTRSDPT